MYPPLCRLLESERDGWKPGSCISICITRFLAWSRISYARSASRRNVAADKPSNVMAITPKANDHEIMLNFGYMSQSRRYALDPKIKIPKNIIAPVKVKQNKTKSN